MLFELSVFDVNGTPKVFPAELTDLRELRRNDDLIDVEFLAICRAGLPGDRVRRPTSAAPFGAIDHEPRFRLAHVHRVIRAAP